MYNMLPFYVRNVPHECCDPSCVRLFHQIQLSSGLLHHAYVPRDIHPLLRVSSPRQHFHHSVCWHAPYRDVPSQPSRVRARLYTPTK